MASGKKCLTGSESASSGFDHELGEALLKASAAEAALLAEKAEGLSQVLGLGPLSHGLTKPQTVCELTGESGVPPLQPAGKASQSEGAAAEANRDRAKYKLSPTFKCKSTGQKRGSPPQLLSEGEEEAACQSALTLNSNTLSMALGSNTAAVKSVSQCEVSGAVYCRWEAADIPHVAHAAFRSLDNPAEPREEEQQVAFAVESGKRRRNEAAADGNAEAEQGAPQCMQTEDLFYSPCSADVEQLCLPDRDCQPGELQLAKTVVLICLADMRDSCIPEVFVHPIDRKLRRRRVEMHMIHVRDCDVMQQLLPYMHLFELPLVKDLLPHKMHAAAQRLLFSSLDMHARASESLYFPSYFEVF
ncbi:hypothetical protein Esti_001373 [Eimeria stiedai]